MKFINYTNDGRVVVQHAALILSKCTGSSCRTP